MHGRLGSSSEQGWGSGGVGWGGVWRGGAAHSKKYLLVHQLDGEREHPPTLSMTVEQTLLRCATLGSICCCETVADGYSVHLNVLFWNCHVM